MQVLRLRSVYRLLLCLCLSPVAFAFQATRADAQPAWNCAIAANTPIAGFGGVGGNGTGLCYNFIENATIYVLTVKLWRRDANNNYYLEATKSVSCVPGSSTCGLDATAFKLYAPAGWYHTESRIISDFSTQTWHANSGEFFYK